MGRIPVLKPNEVMRILRRLGFDLVRQKGSHCQFKHPDVIQPLRLDTLR